MADRIDGIKLKIERGRDHIRELNGEVRSFLETNPYVVGTKRDPQTRCLVYYLVSVRETPVRMAVIAGDALQNLRSALDHLAYQLFIVGTGGRGGPGRHIYFPIADDADKYKAEAPTKLKGLRQDAMDAINAVKPYQGGNDTLWCLHRLNIVDKHRLLITVGSAFRSVNLGKLMEPVLQKAWSTINDARIVAPDAFYKPADRLFPLKAGVELLVDSPDAEVNEKLEFRFEVAFGETGIVEGEPLVETLHNMTDVVDKIVSGFARLL